MTKSGKGVVTELVQKIQSEIQARSTEEARISIEKYMRNIERYRGLKISDVESLIFKDMWNQELKSLDLQDKKEIALELLKQNYGEDKFFGNLMFEKLKGSIDLDDIQRVESLVSEGKIVGWSNTDSLCGMVFKHWAQGKVDNVKYVCSWKNSKSIWLQRASCVTFVTLAKHNDESPNFKGFTDILLETCGTTIRNQERFVQLGTGWLLRNIGMGNKERLLEFIRSNYAYFSAEGLRYAVKKLDPEEKKELAKALGKSSKEKLEGEDGNGSKRKNKKIES